jgi:uncharacterized membrane protein HdeD (DUF308 family)
MTGEIQNSKKPLGKTLTGIGSALVIGGVVALRDKGTIQDIVVITGAVLLLVGIFLTYRSKGGAEKA